MTAILESYHTHAEGKAKGWWGSMWHPAHFDDNYKEIEGTKWTLEVRGAESLDDARRNLRSQWLANSHHLFSPTLEEPL